MYLRVERCARQDSCDYHNVAFVKSKAMRPELIGEAIGELQRVVGMGTGLEDLKICETVNLV